MIVLDTNVISAVMHGPEMPRTLEWLDQHPRVSIWTTAITIFELHYGIERQPHGKQRAALTHALDVVMKRGLKDRVLMFDEAAAREGGRLFAERRRRGKTIDLRDTMIAGIILARRATLATRNTRHFDDLGLTLIDPLTA
jgi:predicted nucleic acid-binding protein